MTKKRKIIITICILISLSGILIYNSSLNINKKVYVVSPKENKNEGKIENKSSEKKMISEKKEITKKNNNDKNNDNKDKKIYISGQVKMPGVISVKSNGRLIDAIEKLGGLTDEADLNRVNLAMEIEDGHHYIIPKIGEQIITNQESSSTDNSVKQGKKEGNNNDKVNINSADIKQLDTLPGVGEATAQKIIDYRDKSGGFKSLDDMKNVKGIGDKKFDELKDHICVQ